jgi:hypothetical protein
MWGPFSGAGAIDLTVSGGTAPYTYRWNAGVSTQDLSAASPGMYSVTVTDINGCTAMTTLYVGRKNSPLTLSTAHINVSGNGGNNGSVDLSVIGGVIPAIYRWSNGATTEDLTGLSAGVYTVIVTDAFGKMATTSVTVSQPGRALALATSHQNVSKAGADDGFIDLSVMGGVAPYTYRWNAGAATQDLTRVVAGLYTVTVTDAMGVTATASVRVEVGRMPLIMVRKSVIGDDLLISSAVDLTTYPNPAKDRATVKFSLAEAGKYSLELYDIRGAKVKTISSGKAEANQALEWEVNVAKYAKGVYLLKLVTDKSVSSKRLLIER